ncbi:MAG: hypothetical protein ACI4F6_06325 [Acutalibacteraceae bacterium]
MAEQKLINNQAVKSSSRDRDTDADGLPDRIDSQYSYPPVEQVKRTREMQRAHQANVPRQKHRR